MSHSHSLSASFFLSLFLSLSLSLSFSLSPSRSFSLSPSLFHSPSLCRTKYNTSGRDGDNNEMDLATSGSQMDLHSIGTGLGGALGTKGNPKVKIALSLYKVQQNIYLLDFQRIEVNLHLETCWNYQWKWIVILYLFLPLLPLLFSFYC